MKVIIFKIITTLIMTEPHNNIVKIKGIVVDPKMKIC